MRIGTAAKISLAFCLLSVAAYLAASRPGTAAVDDDRRRFPELRPRKVQAFASGISINVRDLPPAAPEAGNESGKMGRAEQQARSVDNKVPFRKIDRQAAADAERPTGDFSGLPMPPVGVNFEGINSNDNFAAYGFRIVPPDTIGDVGPDHYVQAVNSLFRVFDKNGNPLTPPLKMSNLFTSLGTACSVRDDGDPIVLYDTLADRWILSQFCKNFPPFRQMIAVSRTSDPTGDYFVYEFVMPNVKLNDYPKLAVWPDAIYMSTDEFYGSEYAGSGVFAFDRSRMYEGDPVASYIYFDLASPTTIRLGGLLPVDLDGLTPPPDGLPGMFVGYTATEYGDTADAIRLFEFSADFTTPSNSSFSETSGSPFTVPPFDPTSPAGRADIDQPVPGEKLDSQSDRLMYRAAYTAVGDEALLTVNQTVQISESGLPYRAGLRVHVLKRSGSGGFQMLDSSTAGSDETSRFMGAAAADTSGNIAVAYSTSNNEKPPGIFYTGRLASDPPGTFRREGELISGTGVQTAFGFRWGDYTGLSVDPSDGCTFWMTNQYYSLESQTESPFGWRTRTGSFRFPECVDSPAAAITGTVTDADTGLPVEGAKVDLGSGISRYSSASGSFGPASVSGGNYDATVTAEGYLPASVSIVSVAGQTVSVDITLEPTAVLQGSGVDVVSESCAVNGAVEPGETVTVGIPLRNTGARSVSSLTAELVPSVLVLNASHPQVYGPMPSGGPPVTREFSFTVSSGAKCGQDIQLRLRLFDGADPIGESTVGIATGRKRIAFSEDFEAATIPSLPNGWMTSAEGGQSEWTTTGDRADSGSVSVFSPDPRVVGLNELVTPPIQIESDRAQLSFRNWYELETTFLRNRLYDGSVLEISIGSGKWEDILDAGGAFRTGGYDLGFIDSCCQNPLAGRRGWSGRSGINNEAEFIDTVVDLPPSAAGSEVRFRWRVGTDIGTFREGQYLDDIEVSDGYVCDCGKIAERRSPFDFDGDGRTDLSLFLASDDSGTPDFRVWRSSDNIEAGYFWGSTGDIPVNADYDGDGITDLAVLRPAGNIWFILRSSDSTFAAVVFGLAGDVPAPADFDGDGLADISVFRPSDGFWYRLNSSDSQFTGFQFGVNGDLPVPSDYDGDGIDDAAVYRPPTGVWYVFGSQAGFSAAQFGLPGDKPVPGDFDGDSRSDLVVFRPSDGIWYLLGSEQGFRAVPFGLAEDLPLQADLDGDGRRDPAVYRPSTGVWYGLRSSDGSAQTTPFGGPLFTPVPGIYVR